MASELYAKTEKGRNEIARRQLGLTGRQRTLLILLDGRKPCSALDGMMPADQVALIVGELLALDRRVVGVGGFAAGETRHIAIGGLGHRRGDGPGQDPGAVLAEGLRRL